MSKNSFLKEAMYENHPQYQQAISIYDKQEKK